MDSDTRTRRRTRRSNIKRGHVRPMESDRAPASKRSRSGGRPGARVTPREGTQPVQRMQPREGPGASRAQSVSLTQRRAARRARKRAQARAVARPRRQVNIFTLLSWRVVSGVIVLGLTAMLYVLLSADVFYVNAVGIQGTRYLTGEEVFRYSGIAQDHIFWVDAEDVEAELEKVPQIADAQVLIWHFRARDIFTGSLPDTMVQILVSEREPALIWEQQIRVWVDVNGIVMKQREDRPDLLRIVVPDAQTSITEEGTRIPKTIVDGALLLKRWYPELAVLLYDPHKGLGHRDTRGWTVWYGTGEDMEAKLLVYNALVEEIYPDIQPGEINMRDPDRPTFTVLWRN